MTYFDFDLDLYTPIHQSDMYEGFFDRPYEAYQIKNKALVSDSISDIVTFNRMKNKRMHRWGKWIKNYGLNRFVCERENGCPFIVVDPHGFTIEHRYYNHIEKPGFSSVSLHRINGPALIDYIKEKGEWYLNGIPRDDISIFVKDYLGNRFDLSLEDLMILKLTFPELSQ